MRLRATHTVWRFLAVLLGAGLLLGTTPLLAADPGETPVDETPIGEMGGPGYVAEILDSTYLVGPAEFFALDLPIYGARETRASHLFGRITATGRARDIMVRIFTAPDYQLWLKKKGGAEARALWTSPRGKQVTVDHALPAGEPIVLLLDNGYSIRSSKRVHCQLQIRYDAVASSGEAAGAESDFTQPLPGEGGSGAGDDVLPPPRPNEEEVVPPPPPPPPDEN